MLKGVKEYLIAKDNLLLINIELICILLIIN